MTKGMKKSSRSPLVLAGFLAATGVSHFLVPKIYDEIVPRLLPGKANTYTKASGVAELALAAALAAPPTRRVAGTVAAAMFAAFLPAHIQMAYDWRETTPAKRAIAYGRIPLQAPLVAWALSVRRKG
jgi:uncharacterized membrane protein